MSRRAGSDPLLRRGVGLLVGGTGPLVLVVVAAALGWTRDPNPSPIGLCILAFVTFWPSLVMIVLGVARRRRARLDRPR